MRRSSAPHARAASVLQMARAAVETALRAAVIGRGVLSPVGAGGTGLSGRPAAVLGAVRMGSAPHAALGEGRMVSAPHAVSGARLRVVSAGLTASAAVVSAARHAGGAVVRGGVAGLAVSAVFLPRRGRAAVVGLARRAGALRPSAGVSVFDAWV